MARRWLAIAALLGLLIALTARAGAQGPFPPCTDLGDNPPSIDAFDLDDNTHHSGFTATHTIRINLSQGSAPDNSDPMANPTPIQWSLPPGITQIPANTSVGKQLDLGPARIGVFVDSGASYPITASWQHDDGILQCSVSVSTTLNVQAATPLKLSNPNRKNAVKSFPSWHWSQSFGGNADLRPIQVLYRSVARRQFPSGPFTTYTAVMRVGDHGYNDGIDRTVKLHRFKLTIVASNREFEVHGQVSSSQLREKPLGYEVKLIQGGRQLGDLRVAAKCGAFGCRNTKFKLQR